VGGTAGGPADSLKRVWPRRCPGSRKSRLALMTILASRHRPDLLVVGADVSSKQIRRAPASAIGYRFCEPGGTRPNQDAGPPATERLVHAQLDQGKWSAVLSPGARPASNFGDRPLTSAKRLRCLLAARTGAERQHRPKRSAVVQEGAGFLPAHPDARRRFSHSRRSRRWSKSLIGGGGGGGLVRPLVDVDNALSRLRRAARGAYGAALRAAAKRACAYH